MFLEAGGGAARRAQPAAAGFACGFALRAKSGAAVVGGRQGSCHRRGWQRAAAGGDGSGLPRADGSGLRRAAGCGGRGRPAGRAAKPHTAPAGGRGGLRPGGAEGLPAVLLRGAAARPQKTRPGKLQFSGPGLVLIDSPCARSGGVFPPGSGQGRWSRRGSW